MFESLMGVFFAIGRPLFGLMIRAYKALFGGVYRLIKQQKDVNKSIRDARDEMDLQYPNETNQ